MGTDDTRNFLNQIKSYIKHFLSFYSLYDSRELLQNNVPKNICVLYLTRNTDSCRPKDKWSNRFISKCQIIVL